MLGGVGVVVTKGCFSRSICWYAIAQGCLVGGLGVSGWDLCMCFYRMVRRGSDGSILIFV